MLRKPIRLAFVAGVAAAASLLVTTPAVAGPTARALSGPVTTTPGPIVTVPIPLPLSLPCSTPWTHVIIGTNADDVLVGTDENDLILGLDGNDTIDGGNGRDTLIGGDDDDDLAGGPGNDCIIGGDGYDTAWRYTYFGPNGNDDNHTVEARYTY